MNYQFIKDELNRILELYRPCILTSNFSLIDESQLVTWNGYSPGIFKNLYTKEYETIVRDRQYSYLLTEDDGCLQFYFEFEEDVLQKAKLAYYPYPALLNEEADEVENYMDDSNDQLIEEYYYDLWTILSHKFELDISDEGIKKLIDESREAGNFENEESILYQRFELKYRLTNSSHVRIDYDINATSHHKCEVQFGGINVIRLPLKRLITPLVFFEWIIRYIKPPAYNSITGAVRYTPHRIHSNNNFLVILPFEEDNIFIDHL